MATMHIRGVKDSAKEIIRVRAAQRGRSMEAEARSILEESAGVREPEEHFYYLMRRAVAKYGGVDLELPPREAGPPPLDFSE